jgi:uncharacterized protein YciI
MVTSARVQVLRNGSIPRQTKGGSAPWRAARPQNVPTDGISSSGASRHAPAMFVIELSYKADLSRIDAAMPAHVAFLKKHYASGDFLVSGRKVPRDGGIIIAVGESRESVEAIMHQDPFCKLGLAEARVIEFRASQRADDIQQRIATRG